MEQATFNRHLTDIASSSEKDTTSVEFMYDGQRFKVTTRSWSGMSSDSFVDFLLTSRSSKTGRKCSPSVVRSIIANTEQATLATVSRPSKSAATGRSHCLSTMAESRLNATRPLLSLSIFARKRSSLASKRRAASNRCCNSTSLRRHEKAPRNTMDKLKAFGQR